MDVGTIATTLLALGAIFLFLVLMRRLPPAEDDAAAVVATIVGTPIAPERPPADLEEPVRWRLELLAQSRVYRQSIARTSIGSPTPFSVSVRGSESE
jgi:hypothetical protein